MGRMTIPVDAKVDPVISVNTFLETNSIAQYDVTVNVTGMTTRYVSITATGEGASPTNVQESITSSTLYSIILEGIISSNAALNTVNATVRIIVRENSASGNILENRTFTRSHTGQYV